jgi:hypothetical protein
MKTTSKNKAHLINKLLNHRLDGTWEYKATVWMKKGFNADFIIDGLETYKTEEQAVKDLNKLLKELGLV